MSISISFPDKSVFLTTKALDNLFLIPLCHNVGSAGFVLTNNPSVKMGQAHVHRFSTSVHDRTHILLESLALSFCILQRQRDAHTGRQIERQSEIGMMCLSH